MAADSSSSRENEELSSFLAKVDKIGDLVKDLSTSGSSLSSAAAIGRADAYLKHQQKEEGKIVSERTVVNTKVTKEDEEEVSVLQNGTQSHTPETISFCRALEEDAQERAEKRKERERIGKDKKKKANALFRSCQYAEAVELYSEAIEQTPWDISLYTNRALTYHHIGKHEDAIRDCDTAIRFEPKTLRAYIYKGKALVALGRLEKAKECYAEALEQFPSDTDTIQGYICKLQELSRSETPRAT